MFLVTKGCRGMGTSCKLAPVGDRFFEYIIDRQFLLLKTDKFFNIKTIECIEQKKEIIPSPP